MKFQKKEMGGGVDMRLFSSCLSLYQEASSQHSFLSHWPRVDHMGTLSCKTVCQVCGISGSRVEAAREKGVSNTC